MKNLFISVVSAAAALATVFSCTRELLVDVVPAQEELSFTAIFADDDTKTAIQSNGTSVWWSGQEKINVFSSSGKSACFTSTGSKDRETAVFTGSFSGSTSGDTFYAVYPYDKANTYEASAVSLRLPVQQVAKEGSFADELFPSMAVSDNYDFRFYHVCGGFRFTLSQEGIRRITFEAIGGESLAGKATVAFGEGDRPAAEIVYTGQSCIALNAPDGGHFKTGKWYYVVAFPAELSEGYKLSFFKDDSWGNKAYSSSVTIKRGTFGSKQNVDSGVAFTNYETVDLGLPSGTQWASFNIGATVPEEYGDYYAWGETEPKSRYGWNNYRLCNITSDKLTKYCRDTESNSQYWGGEGSPDGKLELEEEDDAACVNWGGSWHIPTSAEMNELRDNCSWSWTKVNGVDGWLFTSKINSATLFLPAAGSRSGTDPVTEAGNYIYYWSSSLNTDPRGAWNLWNNSNHTIVYPASSIWCYRNWGFSIRPVKSYQPSGEVPMPEAIDLGLSVKWASFNVGASKPEGYGDYFAWGETEPKAKYDWSTYEWCNGTASTITKYNSEDGKTILDPVDDAAFANLGGEWRTPKRNEWEELNSLCTWKWQAQNGVGGYKVTGPNGNSIFLPAAGLWSWNNNAPGSFTYGYYLSSSANAADPRYPWGVRFASGFHKSEDCYRVNGESVRPVYGSPSSTIHVESVSLCYNDDAFDRIYLDLWNEMTLQAVVSPSYATVDDVVWSSSNPSVVEVEYGRLHPKGLGKAVITATSVDGNHKAYCPVFVIDDYDSMTPVDMGLSVMWSSCDLGSYYPSEAGSRFAWGEVETKEDFTNDNYRFGDTDTPQKYNSVDGKARLEPEDDAATVLLGDNWRIPTAEEFDELLENSNQYVAFYNCHPCLLVESPSTGKSIFLISATGKANGNYFKPSGYWTSDLSSESYCSAVLSIIEPGYYSGPVKEVVRYGGHRIRPVYTE